MSAPLVTGGLAALTTLVLDRTVREHGLPGGRSRWVRTGYRGQPVTLTEGVVLVLGAAMTLAAVDRRAAGACWVAGVTGALDDLHPDARRKGLRGHLGALTRGEVSGGSLKVLGLLAAGLVSVRPGARVGSALDDVVSVSLVAGSANLVNLLDLRPGRALKVALLTGIPLMSATSGERTGRGPGPGTPAAAVVAAAVVLLPADLRGVSMLGDTGANAAGALLGVAASRCGAPRHRRIVLLIVCALTLVSERVSFTAVIEATPVLRELDGWGRPTR